MSRNLSRVALTVALFAGMWGFSSCSQQDSSPKTEILNPGKYSQIPLSLDVEAVLQPLAESSPRAVSLELDDSKKKFPKLKGLTDGSKILCVIRSSNPAQPVNYIQAIWTKKENGTKPTYRIVFDEPSSGTPGTGMGFAYDATKPLGDLSMMMIAGGEWDATQKRVVVSPKLVRADGTSMEYDLPCVSEWRPLQYELKEGTNPSSLQLQLRGYAFGMPNPEHFTLKPVGMFLRMPVEEEMAENGGGHYQLNAITLRSTAFGGEGYFDLSESKIKSLQSNVIDQKERSYNWVFSHGSEDDERFAVVNPTPHSFDASGAVEYGTRKFKRFTPRYYLCLWVMPRGQKPSAVTAENVRTQIYADVEVKPQDGRNVVYSNSTSADEKELQGWAVVPRMKALPVYASDRLVRKADGSDAAFVEGMSYTLTLNLNRPDLPIELLSQTPVNSSFNGFAKRKEDAAYIDNANSYNVLISGESTFRTAVGSSWSIPSFERLSMLLGALAGNGTLSSTVPQFDSRQSPSIAPATYADASNYIVTAGQDQQRMLLAINAAEHSDRVVFHALLFYPSLVVNKNYNRTGSRMSILRGEYATNLRGQKVFRLTMRFLGSYSNDIGILSPDEPLVTAEAAQKPLVAAALDKIIAKGDDYWNDNLRRQDDIIREFPLWEKDPATGAIYQQGDAGYSMGDMGYIVFNYSPKPLFALFGKLGVGYPSKSSAGYPDLSKQAPVFMMRDRLSHK